jgi:hypothetical protein
VLASCLNLQFSPTFNVTTLHILFSLTTNLQLFNISEKLCVKTKHFLKTGRHIHFLQKELANSNQRLPLAHGINIIPKEIPKYFQ